MPILWGDSDWKYSNFFWLLKDNLLFLRSHSEMTGKILEIIRLKNTILRNSWDLLIHVFGYFEVALIRCQPARFLCFVSFFSAFFFFFFSCHGGCFFSLPLFACLNNSWRTALRRLQGQYIVDIDIKLTLAVWRDFCTSRILLCFIIETWGDVTESMCCPPVSHAADCWDWMLEDSGREQIPSP